MRKLIIGGICILSILGCRQPSNRHSLSNMNPTVYKIENPDENFFNWDSIINIDTLIPLESAPETTIGDLYKGLVHNDKIYLFDRHNHLGVIFSIDGHFLSKIGEKGNGPKEYLELRDICLTDDNIYALDYQKIHCYDIESYQYKHAIEFARDESFNPSNLIVFDEKTYYLWNSNPDVWEPNKGKYYRLKKYNGNKVIDELFEFKYETSDDNRFTMNYDGNYYLRPVDGEYNLFKISADSTFNVFEIDFGKKELSSIEIDKLRKSRERNAYLKSNYFKNIYNIFDIENYIYFCCTGPNAQRYEGLINKDTGVITFGRWDYRKSPRFFYSDGSFLYGYYEPSSLIDMTTNTDRINLCFDSIPGKIHNLQIENNIIIIKASLSKSKIIPENYGS
jgi:hypothetical protein